MGRTAEQNWLEDRQYQMILRLTHMVAFEFDPQTGEHFVSPFISEMLAGHYDDRQLSQIMLEDGVLHPDDTSKMTAFRDRVRAGDSGNETILMRLKTKTGVFRWYRMSICIRIRGQEEHVVVVGTIADADEEIRLRERLDKQALYDEVAGIYSKAAFYKETQLLLSRDPTCRYSLVLFDVDRFKMVNELFGLEEGDRLLRYIGKAVAACVRGQETYGRIRDDVFCLCVCRSDEEIVALTHVLCLAVSDFPLSFSITLSMGIYHIDEPHLPVSIMVDRASLAQRTVKGNVLECAAVYCPEMGQLMAREQKILGEMQRGLQTGQFQVYFQPKHRLSDGKVIGAEALVRWIHPEKGMIPPVDFIGLFERNGLITQMDEYVWDTVCHSVRDWLDRGYLPGPISVNVSRVHLYDPHFCDKFIRLTEKYSIPPSMLEIELTESAYVENPRLGDLMKVLQSMGFLFLMDDFGSGYSSLNMLRHISVDILKLDLNFLGFSEQERAGKIIMESVIDMAQRLDIPVIAEGVETAAQADFLREVGCTMVQGFYYSKPMPRAEYERRYLSQEAGERSST